MNILIDQIEQADTIAIGGHIRPDGDCVGSCMGIYQYIISNYPNKEVVVYLRDFREQFLYLDDMDKVSKDVKEEKVYDLFVALDSSNTERLDAISVFNKAKKTVCVDHHITNVGYADVNIIEKVSSTAEVLCGFLPIEKRNRKVSEALYMGIVHDTGMFHYSNTTKNTMHNVSELLKAEFDHSKLVDETYFKKTYVQNQLLGRALLECFCVLDSKVIVSVIKNSYFSFYNATPADLDGIVEQLRITDGIEVAILIYETDEHDYKVSMRSNGKVDVSEIALAFNGGGHVMAAGCTMQGKIYDVINSLTYYIEKQLFLYEHKHKDDDE